VLGIHPHDAKDYNDDVENFLIKSLKYKKIVALGEIGLDYFKMYSPKETQIKVFERQLDIALNFDIPVVIHCRDAYDDVYDILKNSGIKKGVMHCFSGTVEHAEKFLELGLYISFTGTVTFRKSDRKPLKAVPLERLLIETDCPYMTPVPHRGKRNEPKFIPIIADKISEVKKIDMDELEKITEENAYNLFKGLA
jgi:TatD DNase family protein